MPWQFEQLQPLEFDEVLDGYKMRKEEHENITAYFTCQILNTMERGLKHPITPAELLKPLREPQQKKDPQKEKKYLEEKFKHLLKK